MSDVVIRPVRPGDGRGCTQAWVDAGRHYAAIVPDVIQEPDPDGLVEWFERLIAEPRDDDALWLVAVDGTQGRVVGSVDATIHRPDPEARWQLQRDQSAVRLWINALTVAADQRRHGVGTLLMNAAEEWGRRRGATVALTDTNLRSELSVPFYEQRMGYQRQAVILRKPLGGD
jgi:GNAT superfamily N-acetyltransferase